MKIRALSISEANSYINRILSNDPILYNIKIKGEISNLKVHNSKNVYLSLKDENSKINCIIFKKNYDKSLDLKNGMNIIANGYISVYEKDGLYQLYINSIEKDGIGNLYIELNKLKEKLEKEGLFKSIYKQKIPTIPKSIGVITSQTGSVIKDIINVVKRRYPKVNIKVYSANVQGENSKYDICDGIEFFNSMNNVDTIIIARGGGSLEELFSFNEEIVARTIFNSKIPIISAVGHETDFTICDFVSDMRAPTPSAAAEIATPLLEDLNYKLDNLLNRMNKSLDNSIYISKYKLNSLFTKIDNYLELHSIRDKIIQLDNIYDKITVEVQNKINLEIENLSRLGGILHSLSPLNTLNRGYSIVQKNSSIVNSVNDLVNDESLYIIFKDGNVECTTKKIIFKEV